MNKHAESESILWMDVEQARLERDTTEIAQFAPGMEYQSPGSNPAFPHGGWLGRLPIWPFGRPEPEGLTDLIGEEGLHAAIVFSSAHPMVPPRVIPLDPEPSVEQQTQSAWHVAPDGSLCLLQSEGAWLPEASVTELLAKAAGWRIEYALMERGVIDRMTTNGIAVDGSQDHLIAEAAAISTKPPE